MLALEIRDAELLTELAEQLKEKGIDRAALSVIGGVDSFTIITMSALSAEDRNEYAYDQPAELTGTGELVDGELHVHVSCGLEGGKARVGHLKEAHVRTWFAKVHVTPL